MFFSFCTAEGRGGKEHALFAHGPEPIIFCTVEGRGGKEQCSFRTCTRANVLSTVDVPEQMFYPRWKGGVEKSNVLFAHVPEPINFCTVEGQGGREWCSLCQIVFAWRNAKVK